MSSNWKRQKVFACVPSINKKIYKPSSLFDNEIVMNKEKAIEVILHPRRIRRDGFERLNLVGLEKRR